QAVVEQDRLMCVNPVSAAAVLQLGKVFVLRVLLLTMLTESVSASPDTSASGPGGGPPGVQFCPWLDATLSAATAWVRHWACATGAAIPTVTAVRTTAANRRRFHLTLCHQSSALWIRRACRKVKPLRHGVAVCNPRGTGNSRPVGVKEQPADESPWL